MKKVKVMIDSNIPMLPEALSGIAEIAEFDGRKLKRQNIIDFDCQMLFCRSTLIVDELLLYGTKVNFVATATSGSEHIDKLFLADCKIAFFDALGSNALSVTEYVMFGILKWAKEQNIDLQGKSIGIIGFGNVGRRVAYYCKFLGLRVFVNDPPLADKEYSFPDKVEYAELEEIVANCDIITVHTPLRTGGVYKTRGLLNFEHISEIKGGALLIQASRGGVVDEKAWSARARAGEITAIVDVWENEPKVSLEAIHSAYIATPHVAGHAYDGKLKGSLMMAEAFEAFTSLKPNYSKILKELKNTRKIYLENWDNDSIYELLSRTREINLIHKDFLAFSKAGIARGFDLLRRDFPIQREVFLEVEV